MSYSKYTLTKIQDVFGVQAVIITGLFNDAPERPISQELRNLLVDNVPLAIAMATEKARSELIIAPMLLEFWRQAEHKISFFSGIQFDVDKKQGLTGACDFLISRSVSQMMLQAPVFAIVEAKKDDFNKGLPQCMAEMIAARIFNQKKGNQIETIFGAVTNGSVWQFVRLRNNLAEASGEEYTIQHPEKILGIFWHAAFSS